LSIKKAPPLQHAGTKR